MVHTQRLIKELHMQIILVVVSLLAVCWLQIPRLRDQYQVEEDFRTFYWMNKFQDPSLFPNKTEGYTLVSVFGYELPVTFHSLGYGLLFYVASFVVAPVFFSKILPFLLIPIPTWYLFEFGRSIHSRRTGAVLAIGYLLLDLSSTSAISVNHGLQRSFATVLMIALIYYLHRRKYVASTIVIVLSALFYAPVFALGAATWGLFALKKDWRSGIRLLLAQRGIAHLLIAFCISILVLLPVLVPRFADVLASEEPVTVEQQKESAVSVQSEESYDYLWDNPIYGAGG